MGREDKCPNTKLLIFLMEIETTLFLLPINIISTIKIIKETG